jgi:oxygen-independent coproporphyrinogen-3 oxidase
MRGLDTEVSTIYFGGGTPSQLTIGQLRQIFDALYIYNKVEKDAEVTIEVNPDDVTAEFAAGLKQLPVNRVSMGAQTFSDERLRFLHRRHTAAQVSEAVARLRAAGIRNISVDLMYGFPGETLSDWQYDIDCALALNVEHLSAYCLTIEEGTPLYERIECSPDEELARRMYEVLIDRLEAAGFEHYEISNFGKKGFRSRHNSSYWNGTPYIGIGAAAHSFDGTSRSWNISDLQQYIEGMEHGERLFESETIDGDTRYNDMVTVALRTCEGLDLNNLSERHRNYCLKNARRYIDDGLLQLDSDQLSLTRRGLFVSDMIMVELMMIE